MMPSKGDPEQSPKVDAFSKGSNFYCALDLGLDFDRTFRGPKHPCIEANCFLFSASVTSRNRLWCRRLGVH